MSDLRQTLHAAYTLVRSIEANKSTAALTLDHLLQEAITSMKSGEKRDILDVRGESLGQRISRYDQLEQLEKNLDKAVKSIEEAGSDEAKLEALGIFEVEESE